VILVGFFGVLALPANAWLQSRLQRGTAAGRAPRSAWRTGVTLVLAVAWLAVAAAYLLFTMLLRGLAQQTP
jgi:hypothetical protein